MLPESDMIGRRPQRRSAPTGSAVGLHDRLRPDLLLPAVEFPHPEDLVDQSCLLGRFDVVDLSLQDRDSREVAVSSSCHWSKCSK
jgi:hypothetical protein